MYYKEYKIQYILIENTTIIFEAINLFDKKNKTKDKIMVRIYRISKKKTCMDGFSKQTQHCILTKKKCWVVKLTKDKRNW